MNWIRALAQAGAILTQSGARVAKLRTLCAWCGVLLYDGALVNGRESHGICSACALVHFKTPVGRTQ